MKPLSELTSLSGKAAIVTGGAKGIGYGITCRLAEAGAKVLIADLDEATAQNTAQELTAKGWSTAAIKVDVSSEEDVKRMNKLMIGRELKMKELKNQVSKLEQELQSINNPD